MGKYNWKDIEKEYITGGWQSMAQYYEWLLRSYGSENCPEQTYFYRYAAKKKWQEKKVKHAQKAYKKMAEGVLDEQTSLAVQEVAERRVKHLDLQQTLVETIVDHIKENGTQGLNGVKILKLRAN